MRAVVIERFGSADELRLEEVPDPSPPTDGYLVRVVASAVNFADVVERRGLYRKEQTLPGRLGKEAAGFVVARGRGATEFDVGEPVIVVRFRNGCYADLVPAEAHEVLRPPAGFSFPEMAAFATSFATAWWAMHEVARVRPDEAALIQAAAGGVGTAAVNLALSAGCSPVIGGAGSTGKCELVVHNGADACVDYSAGDFTEKVRELTEGSGVDFCLESVGGETYQRSLDVMAGGGRLVIIGFSSIQDRYAETIPRVHPLTLLHRSVSVGGVNIDKLEFTRHRRIWGHLVQHVEQHGIRPMVGTLLPLEAVREAHRALESRRTVGKVVLVHQPEFCDFTIGSSDGVASRELDPAVLAHIGPPSAQQLALP